MIDHEANFGPCPTCGFVADCFEGVGGRPSFGDWLLCTGCADYAVVSEVMLLRPMTAAERSLMLLSVPAVMLRGEMLAHIQERS